jgi:Glycosyltransferase Family 4
MHTNIHLYPSDFTHETRILRITGSLRQARVFDGIHIVAAHRDGLPETEALDETRDVWRVRTRFARVRQGNVWKALKLLEWSLRILWRFRGVRIECINSHSLSTLPLGVLFKLLKGSKLVYDTHELETETFGNTGLRQRVSRSLERHLVRFVDALPVTSDGHASWYRREYGLDRSGPPICHSIYRTSVSCGLPVIVSDFPDLNALVDETDCGWAIKPDADELGRLLGLFTPGEIARKWANAQRWSRTHNWEGEEQKLLEIYRRLIPTWATGESGGELRVGTAQ